MSEPIVNTLQFLVEENETIHKEKLQEEYNDEYPLYLHIYSLVIFGLSVLKKMSSFNDR